MPRKAKGARLYVTKPAVDKRTGARIAPQWVIRDGKTFRRTGLAPEQAGEAERVLQAYLGEKHTIDRTSERRAADIEIADVLSLYLGDVVDLRSRPNEARARLKALARFFGNRRLGDITGALCRAYARSRASQSSARRELEDLRAAINHHRKEGLCREIVDVTLPERSPYRERWLTRSEAAALIWAAYRYREVQKGHATGRRSRRHVARFILVGLYSGTRAGAICSAAFAAGPGQGFLDLEAGVFYRKRGGARETKKRQPPVKLAPRLLAHLRRWRTRPEPPNKQTLISLSQPAGSSHCGTSQNFDKIAKGRPANRMIAERFAVEFNGEPIGKINKAFGRAVADAGLSPDVTPHVLRHTAATWGMQSGTEINKLAGFLGMTAEMLERVYGHHSPDFQADAAAGVSGAKRRMR